MFDFINIIKLIEKKNNIVSLKFVNLNIFIMNINKKIPIMFSHIFIWDIGLSSIYRIAHHTMTMQIKNLQFKTVAYRNANNVVLVYVILIFKNYL